jgi:hypothetical protein
MAIMGQRSGERYYYAEQWVYMTLQIKSPNSHFPPGGFNFTDPRTGMKFEVPHNLDNQAAAVIQHRMANPRVYPENEFVHFEPGAVKQEIVNQVCARNPNLCQDSAMANTPIPSQVNVPMSGPKADNKPCVCGSERFDYIFCKTCGGRPKINGYKCRKCGKQY